jgi:NtrC-family two-component system sensor histidine kinase KinB
MKMEHKVYSTILENLGSGVYLINGDMQLLWCNKEILYWFTGAEKTPLEGKCYETLFSRNQPCKNCPALRVGKNNNVDSSSIQLSSLKGDKRQYQFQACYSYTGEIVMQVSDVTDHYQSERMRSDFIATLTHDLRTPLLAQVRTLEILTGGSFGELNEKQLEVLQAMLVSSRDLLAMVKTLLEVYRYEAGAKVLSKQYFDLAQLVEDCVFELSALADTKNIELVTDLPEVLPMVLADKREIWRVLTNLIGNAIEYTQETGRVDIKIHLSEKTIAVEVQDNGRGIPEEEISKLFDRFSQGTSENISSGTGLGLYLSKQIIQAHNGRIRATSQPGQGSVFSFELPLTT